MIQYAEVRWNVLIAGFFYFAGNFNYYGAGFAL
jgi:hypothetical protein